MVVGELAQRHDDLDSACRIDQIELALQKRAALLALGWRRLVSGRGTAVGSGDERVVQCQPVVLVAGLGLAREPGLVQSPE